MSRFQAWFVHMLLSLTVLCATLDYIPSAERGEKEKYTIITSAVSLGLSFLAVFGHLIVPIRKLLVGTLVEMVMAIIPLSLWIVGTIMIQNPESWFASRVEEETGFEEIVYANLFFFSWAVLFSNIYLVSAIFVNSSLYNPDLIIWVLLFSVSAALTGISSTLKSYICEMDDVKTCRRTNFGLAIGSIVTALAATAVVLTGTDKMLATVHLTIGFLSLVLYILGVVFLTSASGPAVTMSSMYFATWGGAWFSTYAFARGLAEMFGGSLVQQQ